MLEIIEQPDICKGCKKANPNFVQRLLGQRACRGPIIIMYDSACEVEGIPSFDITGSKEYCREQVDPIHLSILWSKIGRRLMPRISTTKPTQMGAQTDEKDTYPNELYIAPSAETTPRQVMLDETRQSREDGIG